MNTIHLDPLVIFTVGLDVSLVFVSSELAPKFRPPIKVETATPEIVELQIQRRADSEANKKEVHGGI